MKNYLIVIFSLLVCVFPAISYADYDDNPTSTPPTVTSKVIQTKVGNITTDKPQFPEFYIWRRVYQKKGISDFKLFLVKSSGELIDQKTTNESYRESTNKNAKGTVLTSTSGLWSVDVPTDDDWGNPSMSFTNVNSRVTNTINVPGVGDDGWGWIPEFWNPTKDFLYISIVEGPSSSRQVRLLQFDPNGNVFTVIGDASRVLRLNSKGDWAVWVDGDENAWADRQINVYSIDANTNYVITSGHSDNVFAGWADNFGAVVDFIKKGKENYFQKNYSAAVTEYQNAINADPRNDFAYGLMGYSYYRNKQDDNALLALKKSLDINPYNLMSYYNLALVYWQMGDTDQAIEAIKQIYIYDSGYRKRIYDDPQFKQIVADPKYLQMEKPFFDR
jgi:hypothetical protein